MTQDRREQLTQRFSQLLDMLADCAEEDSLVGISVDLYFFFGTGTSRGFQIPSC